MKHTLIALVMAATAGAAFAQTEYPNKPIKLIAPYAPGGAADVLARMLASHLSTEIKQPVIVENKPGANTMIAATAVARAPADGYTLLLASSASMVMNPLLYKKLSYNPDKELKLSNILAEAPFVLVTNSQTGMKQLADVQTYAKNHPGKLNYSSVGLGNPLQLTTEMIKTRLGIAAAHIPFNGSAPALTALLGNETQLMVDVVSTSLPQIQAGKLVPLATTGLERSQFLPQTPSLAELGYTGFRASTWFGIATPAATPASVRSKLQAAVDQVMLKPEFVASLSSLYLVAKKPQTQAQLDAVLLEDSTMWRKVVEDNQIVLEN